MHELLYDLLRDVEALSIDGRHPIYPFEKEVTLFRFKIWVLAPVFGPLASTAARLIARIVTMHRRDAQGKVMAGEIKTLDEYRTRLNEEWFERFYKSSFVQEWAHNLRSIFMANDFAAKIEERRAALQMSIDILDFLLRTAKYHPEFATRKFFKIFISRNGFNRRDNYRVPIGEKKRVQVEKTNQPIKPITVERHWDSSPPTLGLAYLIANTELDSLKVNDGHTLLTLMRLANDGEFVHELLGQYESLLDFCTQHLRDFKKHRSWPRLTRSIDPICLGLEPLTADQLGILQNAPKDKA
jgi:hypothetical protein